MPNLKLMTATADVGKFTEGQKLKTSKDMVAYHRGLLKMAEVDDGVLTDEQVLAAINTVDGDNGDAETKRHDALVELASAADEGTDDADGEAKGEPDADAGSNADEGEGEQQGDDEVPSEKASDVEKDATSKATVLANDETTQQHFRDVIAAGRTIKMGPLVVMLDVRRLMPDEQFRLSLPVVGTTWKNRKKGSNEPVDKRRILVRGKNGLKPKTVSTYDLMFQSMPVGADLERKIGQLDSIEKDKANGKTNPYGGWKDYDVEGERDTAVGDRTQGRALLKRAIKLDRKFLESKALDVDGGVTVSWKKDKAGNPLNTRYGIVIVDKRDGTATRKSIDQFLGLNVAEALDKANVAEKGGIFEAFVQSGGGEGDAETPTTTAMDADNVVDEVGMISSFFTIEENRTVLKRRFLKDDAFAASLIELHDEINPWVQDPEARKRYAKHIGEMTKRSGKTPAQIAEQAKAIAAQHNKQQAAG